MKRSALSSMIRINRACTQLIHTKLQPYGYVGVMRLIVLYLAQKPGASQDEIADFLYADKASVARGARRLEDMGHIFRKTDPNNRRQYKLFLTEAGDQMLSVITQIQNEFQQKMIRDISDEEKGILEKLLAQVEENVCGQ